MFVEGETTVVELAGVFRRYHIPMARTIVLGKPSKRLDYLARATGEALNEIATGFGRTGPMFAAEWAGVSPDIMCVGKALTGGMMTLAATVCTDRVATAISAGEVPVLAHGPTFMANPLACATAVASLDLLGSSDYRTSVERIERALLSGLAEARDLPQVRDVRVLGAIGVIELDRPVDMERATTAAIDAGVWLRPFRNLIYAMPPYICTDEEIATICNAMVSVAAVHSLAP